MFILTDLIRILHHLLRGMFAQNWKNQLQHKVRCHFLHIPTKKKKKEATPTLLERVCLKDVSKRVHLPFRMPSASLSRNAFSWSNYEQKSRFFSRQILPVSRDLWHGRKFMIQADSSLILGNQIILLGSLKCHSAYLQEK